MAKVNNTTAPTIASTATRTTGTGPAPLSAASAKRGYAKALSPAFATRTFTLNARGQAAASSGGATGQGGKVTVMGLTALAVGLAGQQAGTPNSASGAAIVAVMLTHPSFTGVFNNTKANGTHVGVGIAITPKFCAGYVTGLGNAKYAWLA